MTSGERFYERSFESLEGIPTDEFMSLLRVKTEKAITFDRIEARLQDGEPLNIKFGTDPTGPDLHLGHIVPIRVLDLFSRANHNIDLIFGDFTAKVGDPSGRKDGRPALTDEKIAENMSTFQDQVNKYFDTKRENVNIHANSVWLGRMALADVFGYFAAINLTEATQRNDFRERMQKGESVSLAETVYGTLMGIDSVHLDTDIEVGGLDQLLNFQQARTVQKASGQTAEEIIMTPILEGTSGDGHKMSKSFDNYVPVSAEPGEVFGKIMSIPDSLIIPYLKAYAPLYQSDLAAIELTTAEQPLEMKKQLATYMAAISSANYDSGVQAREKFERRFAAKNISEADATTLSFQNKNLTDTLLSSGDFKSRSELRRLAEQGGIKINGTKITADDLNELPASGSLVTVGKHRIYTVSGE
ncbi:tyrosine--tRNA ligase [Candidatus Saccharibacteria bacterium CG10_big_fil_rev_8_21_14_0_10_47_8]|nr:MAG: tyrosine--tRNA ligase [Candidatus Saccharibacteria bacterium CG10_big_fil_rev_8_21_14_0_10_47_8]